MFVTIVICALSSAICSAAPNLEVNSIERDTNDGGTDITDVFGWFLAETKLFSNGKTYKEITDRADHDYYTAERKKRAASLVAIGALALRALLKGATPVRSRGRLARNYAKPGDYVTAMKDFLSVSPVDIKERTTQTGVKVMTGRVGDRLLVARSRYGNTHEPLLEIQDKTGMYLEPGEKYIDRIFYKKINQQF